MFFTTIPLYIYTLSPAAVEHMDPFFAEVSILDLQEVHSSDDVIISVWMATTELLLHLGEEVVVWMCQIGWIIQVLDDIESSFLGDCSKADVYFLTVLTCKFPTDVAHKLLNFNIFAYALKQLNCTCNVHITRDVPLNCYLKQTYQSLVIHSGTVLYIWNAVSSK